MNVKKIFSCLLLALLLLYPATLHAQVPANDLGAPGGGGVERDERQRYFDPGQDPFALSPELLRYFGGQEAVDTTGSLFTGDFMKYNGIFTTSTKQLGGARPFTNPVVTNEDDEPRPGGPTFIVITSRYSPSGDLTKDSEITMTVTLRNAGSNLAEGVKFYACLQDDYITLLDEPAPEPPFTNDPLAEVQDGEDASGDVPIESETPGAVDNPEGVEGEEGAEEERETPASGIHDPTINDCFMRLEWESIDGEPIDLEPGEEVEFSWSFQPQRDDIVIRWRMWAEYGSGASYLRHWIPVKNPNPTGAPAGPGGANGVPVSCTDSTANNSMPFPENLNGQQIGDQIADRWKIDLIEGGFSWFSPEYKPLLKVVWDTFSAVECTPYLTEITRKQSSGRLGMVAGNPAGGGLGDYGLNNPPHITVHTPKLLGFIDAGTPAEVTWLLIHEMGHAYNTDRDSMPEYYAAYNQIFDQYGGMTDYGRTPPNARTENFADIIGYFVGRCATEGGRLNPYDVSAPGVSEYYEYTKTTIFGGQEFGPTPPGTATC